MVCFFCGEARTITALKHRNAAGDAVGALACCKDCTPPDGFQLEGTWPGIPTRASLELKVDKLEGLLDEVAESGVELDDERLKYVAVQIDLETWNKIRRALKTWNKIRRDRETWNKIRRALEGKPAPARPGNVEQDPPRPGGETMNAYKLTDQQMRTYGDCQWTLGEWKETSGEGNLCGPGWLHFYTHPLLAALLNPIHANIQNPRLFRVEAEGATLD